MMLPKHVKVGGGAALVVFCATMFGFVLFPAIVKKMLKKVQRHLSLDGFKLSPAWNPVISRIKPLHLQTNKVQDTEMALAKTTDVRKMWEKVPFALDFKIYLFNYTNVDEIQKGGIPIVKEIGPYYFEEWKEKVEIEDHEDTDTITYKKKDTFIFKQELSGAGLTGEEIIIMPHVFILSMLNTVNRKKPAMLSVVSKAVNGIFDNPTSVFVQVKALDILYRGIIINCDRTEFAPKAACTTIKKEAADSLIFEPNNQYRFSLFGIRNGTVDRHVVTVQRGIGHVMDVGKVVAVDGETEQSIWNGECNKYVGTDGTVFPPFVEETDRLESFSGDFCRTFKPWFQKKTAYRGIHTNRYTVNMGDLENDPELHCYCVPQDECPPKGLFDIFPCAGPLYVSMPHFYDCDPDLLNHVKGLNPDANQHEIFIDFEPITGTPLNVRQRVQLNIRLLKTDKLEICKNLPNSIVPVLWIEEGFALNKTFVNMLKYQLFIPKRVITIVVWTLTGIGSSLVLFSIVFHFREQILRFGIQVDSPSKVKPMSEQKDSPNNEINNNHELPKIEI